MIIEYDGPEMPTPQPTSDMPHITGDRTLKNSPTDLWLHLCTFQGHRYLIDGHIRPCMTQVDAALECTSTASRALYRRVIYMPAMTHLLLLKLRRLGWDPPGVVGPFLTKASCRLTRSSRTRRSCNRLHSGWSQMGTKSQKLSLSTDMNKTTIQGIASL